MVGATLLPMDGRGAFSLVGRGVYTVAEAARLTDVPPLRIRRWTQGYDYTYKLSVHFSPPVVAADLPRINGVIGLDFGDLQEIRFLNAFRNRGVGMHALRIAAARAKEMLGRPHPLSTQTFRTDGRTVLADVVSATGDRVLLDLVKNQFAFEQVLAPHLYMGVVFNRMDEPSAWWPLGLDRQVVIDPERAFGAPIVTDSGVPTRVLWGAFKAEGSIEFVSRCFDVDEESVTDAIEFEDRLAA
jgi:uncharacterized protein (DUF433 family)